MLGHHHHPHDSANDTALLCLHRKVSHIWSRDRLLWHSDGDSPCFHKSRRSVEPLPVNRCSIPDGSAADSEVWPVMASSNFLHSPKLNLPLCSISISSASTTKTVILSNVSCRVVNLQLRTERQEL
jgi:hypothetical protein